MGFVMSIQEYFFFLFVSFVKPGPSISCLIYYGGSTTQCDAGASPYLIFRGKESENYGKITLV